MTGVFIRGEKFGRRHTERVTMCDYIDTQGEHCAITETENGVMALQPRNANDCQHPPEARREAFYRFSLKVSRKTQPC